MSALSFLASCQMLEKQGKNRDCPNQLYGYRQKAGYNRTYRLTHKSVYLGLYLFFPYFTQNDYHFSFLPQAHLLKHNLKSDIIHKRV